MSVYVDSAEYKFGRLVLCHMLADTPRELHAMAKRIGVPRRWAQCSRSGILHYDICKSKRTLAVEAGAVELTNGQLVQLISKQKKEA